MRFTEQTLPPYALALIREVAGVDPDCDYPIRFTHDRRPPTIEGDTFLYFVGDDGWVGSYTADELPDDEAADCIEVDNFHIEVGIEWMLKSVPLEPIDDPIPYAVSVGG